jgi:hypothetical protein
MRASCIALVVTLVAGTAHASETEPQHERTDARTSFEAAASLAYAQGLGELHPGAVDVEVTGPGVATELELAYRFLPYAALGVSGAYQAHTATEPIAGDIVIDETADGVSLGLMARLHPMPFDGRDPWLRIGTGYRWLWLSDIDPSVPTLTLHGPRVVQLGLGIDIWLTDGLALGPFAVGDLSVLRWPSASDEESPGVTSFVFGGIRVLFNVESMRSGPTEVALAY